MAYVTISKDYRITIPKEFREYSRFKPGQRLHISVQSDGFTLTGIKDLSEMCGIFKGMDTSIPKETEKH